MSPSIRGSDVFIKADMTAGFAALQRVAAAYPAGEYRAGFLAALEAVRMLFDAADNGMADDLPPAAMLAANGAVGSVRVLPPAPVPAPALRSGVAADGRRFAVRALEVEDWDGQIVSVDDAPPAQLPAGRPAELPPPRRLQPARPAPVDVPDSARVVEVERGSDPVVVRPDLWRLVASDPAFVYDEIAGPGRYVLPADRWVPVPVAWRHRVGVELVPDQWALFVTVDWAIRHLGADRVAVLPGGRRQITG